MNGEWKKKGRKAVRSSMLKRKEKGKRKAMVRLI